MANGIDAKATHGKSAGIELSNLWYLLVALALLVSGCPNVGSFNITRKSSKKTVDGSLAGQLNQAAPFAQPFQFDLNLQRELNKRDAKGAKRVVLENLKFKIVKREGEDKRKGNFDFLDSITFFANADGKDRKKIAWRDPVPEGTKAFDFEVDDGVNLKPYAQKGLQIEAEAQGSAPPEDRTFRGIITLRVDTL